MYKKVKPRDRPPFHEPLLQMSEFWLGIVIGGGAVGMFFLTFFELK